MIDYKELFTIVAIVISMVSGMMAAVLSVQSTRKKRQEAKMQYDNLLKKIELEQMRQELENKIYDINYKLSEDNIRWNKINHLVYDAQKMNFEKDSFMKNKYFDIKTFIENMGIDENTLEFNSELVFMVTPFQDLEWETFVTVREVCLDLSLKCIRGDEKHIKGEILPSIIKSILEARIIVVNLNGRNPNVFYELGIAHALGKKTILISKFGEELPFDVKSKNVILYKENSELKIKIKEALFKAVL
ncbi:hypothetical protein D3D03_09170 [Exiguobacterium sp. RIT452]|uniref:Uncharacterized protein n=1 Tax=Exiguobacterium undae TaxID=169177 RepID=A0ABX2V725_9BACL|nr:MULTISPECIES: hypothetical protein [Exiguobacterium]OAN12719.1 hypothetical protein A3783_10375 [Exiguobacterium undae]RJO98907.1 hypothetical protein D3D03_09170 [Exiguobacterium sp. RIT452]